MKMKKILLLIVLFYAQSVSAALPPGGQNMVDLDVMADYIKSNREVAMIVESIDLENYIIYLNNGCKVIFGREENIHPEPWVGAEEPLEFKSIDQKGCIGTVDANLDIYIPSASYRYPSSNIWFQLEYKGVDANQDHIWKLIDTGFNE